MSTPLTSRRRPFNVIGAKPVFSPQTRRSLQGSSIEEPGTDSPLPEVQNEQDLREKREKRRSRTFAHTAGSPLVRPTEENQGERSKLTNDQLASHYVNCIKLSTENKITAKNAFNLHLIDHMNEMLKQRCEGVLNFQMAGGTIFASAKIYASRVDAVHSETYKVMSSLGRGTNDEKAGSDQESQEVGEENVQGKRKKKRSKVLENNPTALRMKKMDVICETDPLDQYYSSVFDVASTSGLLINHLGLCKDGITVRFDSDMDSPMTHNICGGKKPTIPGSTEQEQMDAEQNREDNDPDRKQEINGMFFELVKLTNNKTAKDASLCPTLKDFQWTDPDQTFDWDDDKNSGVAGSGLPDPGESHNDFDDEDDVIMDSLPCDDDDLGLRMSQDAHPEPEKDPTAHLQFGMDEQLLMAFEPGEYSYFKPEAFSTWEGPNHWKMKLRSKPAAPVAESEKSSGTDHAAKGKKRKRAFYVDFHSSKLECDEREFEHTKKSKETSKRIREKWRNEKDDKLLPSAGEYNVPHLAKCILQPSVHIRPVSLIRSTKSETALPEVDCERLGMYNYDNPNDKNNYCPNLTDDEDNGSQDVEDAGQVDDLPPNFAHDYNGVDQVEGFPDMMMSQSQTQTSQLDIDAMLKGDHLISHPKKVEKISIAYAKKATRIDVRRLKSAMWTVLHKDDTSFESHSKSKSPSSSMLAGSEDESDHQPNEDAKTFSNMYQVLPKLMPALMADNLSIPLAFTCLLHLANEKSLKIVARSDMSDLSIMGPAATDII